MSEISIDVHVADSGDNGELAADAHNGLSADFKELPPKYFYDERGSRLFERITELAEYYPTRAEREILADQGAQVVADAGATTLVELGSGVADKTRHLLDAMRDAGMLERYVPVDICEEITRDASDELSSEYPGMKIHGVICDFERDLEVLPRDGRRLIALLGGTIGNFAPAQRDDFLRRIAATMDDGDRLLLGTDLVKDRATLEAAYDDSEGVTAEFNKNVLRVLNRELGADFEPERFEHVAHYDDENARIDIRLRSTVDQKVRIEDLDMDLVLAAGEEIRTEISSKFTRERLERIYDDVGMPMQAWYTDRQGRYGLSLAARA